MLANYILVFIAGIIVGIAIAIFALFFLVNKVRTYKVEAESKHVEEN